MNDVTLLSIDIAKSVFQLHGVDERGAVKLRRRLSRHKLVEFIAKLPACTIAMEACGSSNHWARKLSQFGHEVKLISPQFVKPYVKSNKSDRNDAEAICEAASRPSMRFVSPKTVFQQDIQALHRIRSRLVKGRTALINQIRGLLAEFGIVLGQGPAQVSQGLPDILEDADNELSSLGREYIADLYEQLREQESKISSYDRRLGAMFAQDERCQQISKIEGIGLLTATAMVMTIGDGKAFKSGRELSAYLGLVPRQHSSGNTHRLLGISKRGDGYIRQLLVHGARTVMRHCDNKTDRKSEWVKSLKMRKGWNKTAVALANKNARIVWAVLSKGEAYRQAR